MAPPGLPGDRQPPLMARHRPAPKLPGLRPSEGSDGTVFPEDDDLVTVDPRTSSRKSQGTPTGRSQGTPTGRRPREALRFGSGEFHGFPSCCSSGSLGSESDSEVGIDRLLDNDVSHALHRGASMVSLDFESFLVGLGFEPEERRSRGSRAGSKGSGASARHGHADFQSSIWQATQAQNLIQTIVGPASEGWRIEPRHLALTRIWKHIFSSYEEPRDSSNTTATSLSSARTLQSAFHKLLQRPAGKLAEKPFFVAFFMLLTIYAIFGIDIVSAVGDKDQELTFQIINTVVFFFFMAELVVHSLGKKEYLCSIPFALDIIAIASIFSETWFVRGDLFDEQSARISRMARSSRVTRLARLARIARFTRMLPSTFVVCDKSRHQLAETILKRRLWRIFLFLDHERKGYVSVFDVKVFYVVMLRNHLSILSRGAVLLKVLERDALVLSDNLSESPDVLLTWEEFGRIIFMTHLAKRLLHFLLAEIEQGESVWTLTKKLGDRSALKIACIVLLLIGSLAVFDDDDVAGRGPRQSLAHLDAVAHTEHLRGPEMNLTYLCQQVEVFAQRHDLMFLYLDGRTHWEDDRCVAGNATDPQTVWERIDSLVREARLRNSDFLKLCWPRTSECGMHEVSSACLINYEAQFTRSTLMVILSTVLIIVLLLAFICVMNGKMRTFTKTLLNPLRALLDDMVVLSNLDLTYVDQDMPDTETTAVHELAELQMSFRSLRYTIRSWSKYVPPSIVKGLFNAGLEAKLGVAPINATILFCDVEGFEEKCGHLEPTAVLPFLSQALGTISEVISRCRGTLLEFIGDEVLAVFNAPNEVKHHVYAGVMSALEIHVAFENLPPLVARDGHVVPVRCRCGVHTGRILAGNIGSHHRMKYGLIGDGINLTARLKGLNTRYSTKTLVSKAVTADEYCSSRITTRPVDIVAVKGKTLPTVVYEALSPDSPSMAMAVKQHQEAFKLYQERNFGDARLKFAEVLQAYGDVDGPSCMLMGRCLRYIKEPPPADWDGVERLTAKSFQAQTPPLP